MQRGATGVSRGQEEGEEEEEERRDFEELSEAAGGGGEERCPWTARFNKDAVGPSGATACPVGRGATRRTARGQQGDSRKGGLPAATVVREEAAATAREIRLRSSWHEPPLPTACVSFLSLSSFISLPPPTSLCPSVSSFLPSFSLLFLSVSLSLSLGCDHGHEFAEV